MNNRVPQGRGATESGLAALRRFAAPISNKPSDDIERCELCGEQLAHEHPHLVDLRQRSINCACTACALLFDRPGAPYRTVPDRVLTDPSSPLTEAEWTELRIPVGMAFFFSNSDLDQVVASYPSAAGVTECELDLAAWERLAAAHPLLATPEKDVEALFVVSGRAPGVASDATGDAADTADGATDTAEETDTADTPDKTDADGGGIETYLVPIDICYSLAGALRMEWHGFDGGEEVRKILTDFLADLRRRARPLTPAAG